MDYFWIWLVSCNCPNRLIKSNLVLLLHSTRLYNSRHYASKTESTQVVQSHYQNRKVDICQASKLYR
jgi:hypothetical protein